MAAYVYIIMSRVNRRAALWSEIKRLGNPSRIRLSEPGMTADRLERELIVLRTPPPSSLPPAELHKDHGRDEHAFVSIGEGQLPTYAFRVVAHITEAHIPEAYESRVKHDAGKNELRRVDRMMVHGWADIGEKERARVRAQQDAFIGDLRAKGEFEKAERVKLEYEEHPVPLADTELDVEIRYKSTRGRRKGESVGTVRKKIVCDSFTKKGVYTARISDEEANIARSYIGRYLRRDNPALERMLTILGFQDRQAGMFIEGGFKGHVGRFLPEGSKYGAKSDKYERKKKKKLLKKKGEEEEEEEEDEDEEGSNAHSFVDWMVIEYISPLKMKVADRAANSFVLEHNYGAFPGDLRSVPRFLATKWISDLVYDKERNEIVQKAPISHEIVAGRCGYDLIISAYSEAWRRAREKGRRQKILRVDMTYDALYEWFHGRPSTADADWGLSLQDIARFTQEAGTSFYCLPWAAADLDFYRRLRGDTDSRHPVMFSSVVRDQAAARSARVRSLFAICQNNHLYALDASKDTLGRLFSGTDYAEHGPADILEGLRPAIREWRAPQADYDALADLRGIPILMGARCPILIRQAETALPSGVRCEMLMEYASVAINGGEMRLWDPAKARCAARRMIPVLVGDRPHRHCATATISARVDSGEQLLGAITAAAEGIETASCRVHIGGSADMSDVVRALWGRFSICPSVRVKDGQISSVSIAIGGINYKISRDTAGDAMYETDARRMSGRDSAFWGPMYSALWRTFAARLLRPSMCSEYAPDVHFVLRSFRHSGASGALCERFYPQDCRAAVDFNQHHPGTMAALECLPIVGSWNRFARYRGQIISKRALYIAEVDIGEAQDCCLAIAVERVGAYWGEELLFLTVHGAEIRPVWVLNIDEWVPNPWRKWYPRFLSACAGAPTEVRKKISVRLTGLMQRIRDVSGAGTLHARAEEAAAYFANVRQIEALDASPEAPAGESAIFLAWNDQLSLYKNGPALCASYFLGHCRLKVARVVDSLTKAGGRVCGLHVDQIDFVGAAAVNHVGSKGRKGDCAPSLSDLRLDSVRFAKRVLGKRLAQPGSAELTMPGFLKLSEPHFYSKKSNLRTRFAETAPRWSAIVALVGQYREEESIESMIGRECRAHMVRDGADLNTALAEAALARAESALANAKAAVVAAAKSIAEETRSRGSKAPIIATLKLHAQAAAKAVEEAENVRKAAHEECVRIENEVEIARAGVLSPPPQRRGYSTYVCRDPLERDADEYRAFFARARADNAPVFIHGEAPGVGKTFAAVNYATPEGRRILVVAPNHSLEQQALRSRDLKGEPIRLSCTTHCKLLGINPITHVGEKRLDLREFAGATIFIDEFFTMPRYMQAEMLAFVRQNREKYFFVASGCANQNVPIGDHARRPDVAEQTIREVFRDNLLLRIVKRVQEGESRRDIVARSSALRGDVRALERVITGESRNAQRASALRVLERHTVRDLPPLSPETGELSGPIPATALPPLEDIESGRASIIVYTHKTRRAICDHYYAAGDWPKVGQKLIACRDEMAVRVAKELNGDNHWSKSRRAFADAIDGLGVHFYANCEYTVEAISDDGVVRLQLTGDIARENLLSTNATQTIYLPATFGDAIRCLKFDWARAFVAGVMTQKQTAEFDRWLAPHSLDDSIIRALFMPAVAMTGHSAQGRTMGGIVHIYDSWRSFASANWLYVAATRSGAARCVVHAPELPADASSRRQERGVPIISMTKGGAVIANWTGTSASGAAILSDWRPWNGVDWVPEDVKHDKRRTLDFLELQRERALIRAANLARKRVISERPPTNSRKSSAEIAARDREWPTERDLGVPIGNLALVHVVGEQHFAPMAESALARRLEAGNKMIEGRRTLADALAAVPDAEVVIQDVEAGHRFAAFSCAALAVDWAAAKLAGGSQMSIHEWIRFDRATYLPVDFEAEGAALNAMRGVDLLGSIRRALEKVFPGVKCLICVAHKWSGEGADRRFAKASFHIHTKVVARSLPEAKAAARMFRDALPAEMRSGVDMQIYSSGHALRMAYSDKFDHGAWAARPKQVVEMIGYRAYSAADTVERILSGAPEPEDAAPGSAWGVLAETISAVPVAKVLSAHELALNDEIAAAAEEEQFASATRIAVAEPIDSAAISLAVKEGVFAGGEWTYYRSAVRADGRRRVYLLRAAGVAGRVCELCGWAHSNNNLCLNLVPAEGNCAVHVGCARRSEIGRKIGGIDT